MWGALSDDTLVLVLTRSALTVMLNGRQQNSGFLSQVHRFVVTHCNLQNGVLFFLVGSSSSDRHHTTRNVRSSAQADNSNAPLELSARALGRTMQQSSSCKTRDQERLRRSPWQSVVDALRARSRVLYLESVKGALCGSVVDALESIADASENDIITFCKEVSRAHDRQQHTYGIRSTTGSGTTTYEAPEE